MKTLTTLLTPLALVASLLVGAGLSACADPRPHPLPGLDNGWAAYERGDYATAFREWLPLAEEGHMDAQFDVGSMYGQGKGVPANDALAAKWFRKAAEQGHGIAQFNLGIMYELGEGVPQDYVLAATWYGLAVDAYLQSAELSSRAQVGLERVTQAAEEALLQQEQRQQKQAMQAVRETCKEFGFKEGSESLAQCMFDLFKLEQGAIQSQTTPSAASDGAAAAAASQNALLEQQQRQRDEMRQVRELNAAIQLMEQGFEMAFPPPKPTTTCRWNEIMQTMTCN